MNRLNILSRNIRLRNISGARNIGFNMIPYHEQYESRDNETEIKRKYENNSYGKWIEENRDATRIERQKQMKKSLDKFYSTEIKTN